jgi:hypothetical protein
VPDRRGSRFVLEVLFLLALAVGLTLAKLTPFEIAGVMLAGWVIVAALEWAAWRSEPHYGSGLPPRYYVPRVNLPPAQPLEQVAAGYPEAARDEEPTWIASAALRQEMLGEWPVTAGDPESAPEPERQVEPAAAVVDPWLVVELPAAPLGELESDPEPEPEPDTDSNRDEDREPEHALDVVLTRSVQGVAKYSLDPLADPPVRRRFGRGGGEQPLTLEVPARPEGVRSLPGRSARQD